MLSMISARSGTKTVAMLIPSIIKPKRLKPILSFGNPRSLDGPNMYMAAAPTKNEI